MALLKSTARTRVRQRIRDTVAAYEYSDALLDTYLAPALKEIATAVCTVDPDFYLKNQTITGYTDARDPDSSSTTGNAYEFYDAPANLKSLRWLERGDGGLHYKIPVVSARDQENFRFGGNNLGFQAVSVVGGSTTALSTGSGRETASLHGNKIRIVPPPTAAGATYRAFFDAFPDNPQGESEPVDVPAAFEEALILAWGVRPLMDDGDPLAASLAQRKDMELAIARTAVASRSSRNIQIGKVF